MRRHCFISLICLAACMMAGEVTLDLPDPLVPGARMTGSLRIIDPPSDVTGVTLPTVAGLEWRMSNQNSSQTRITNGARQTVITVGLILRAAQRGRLDLPPVQVQMADGSTMSSAATVLRVDQGDTRLVGDAFAETSFEPARIVPGQPTSLIYKIYLRQGEVSKLGIGPPEGAITLGEPSEGKGRTVDAQGRAWAVTTITWPITHATPGSYTVRGQQDYQIAVGSGFFDQRVSTGRVAVAPATLTVEELPAAGRPDGFSGLIGPLSVAASLDRARVAVGEGVLLSLTVTSRQTDLVKRPALSLAGVQFYPKEDTSGNGTRTLTWDVVPSAAGTVSIPSMTFAYFDPASMTYRSADTAILALQVIPGRARDLGIVGQRVDTPVSPASAQSTALVLPEAIRGSAVARPPAWAAPSALLAGVILGSIGVLIRLVAGSRRGPHRGRALIQAGTDPARLDAALRSIALAELTTAQREALDALQAALDRHRFGREALPDLGPWLRVLEGVA